MPPPIGPCGGRRAGLGSRAGRDGRGALQGRPFRPVGEERAERLFSWSLQDTHGEPPSGDSFPEKCTGRQATAAHLASIGSRAGTFCLILK